MEPVVMNLGFRVEMVVRLRDNTFEQALRNVTEIHYCYPDSFANKRIAFESDIHGTGCTYAVHEVLTFEAKLESEQADRF